MEAPKVYIETHGCKLNEADSQNLSSQLIEAGYKLTATPEQASVHIVNTCTVTHVADRKARQSIRKAKRINEKSLVIATGCYVERSPEEVSQLEGLDLLIGNRLKNSIVEQIGTLLDFVSPKSQVPTSPDEESIPPSTSRSMLKIQEGCNQICSYCIVPKVRGRERSVGPKILIEHINKIFKDGYKEVVLTGTQLGSYGFDLDDTSLHKMLSKVLEETTIPRLRVSSLQPQEISQELIRLWDNERLCRHFHLPLQSGSSTLLSKMRRRYSALEYKQAVELIRSRFPSAAITADVIVGFPGETEKQFTETYNLCKKIKFANIHLFPYSSRPGTSAYYLPNKVDPKEIRKRMNLMLSLAKEQASDYRNSILGTKRKVLWETSKKVGDTTSWSGLTDNYIRVNTASNKPLRNVITSVTLDKFTNGTVWARIL